MFPLIWRALILSVGLLALLIAGLRALSHDAVFFADVRAAFDTVTDCTPSPCFLNIRIGEDSLSQVAAQTRNQPWVGELMSLQGVGHINSGDIGARNLPMVRFRWNGQQPPIFRDDFRVEGGNRTPHAERVHAPTDASLGDVWQSYGAPILAWTDGVTIGLYYPRFSVWGRVDCEALWASRVTLRVEVIPAFDPDDSPSNLYRRACRP